MRLLPIVNWIMQVKHLPQSGHLWSFFSLMWVPWWDVNSHLLRKATPYVWQIAGLSLVCVIWCLWKADLPLKTFPHSVHSSGFSGDWLPCCLSGCSWLIFPNWLPLYAFSLWASLHLALQEPCVKSGADATVSLSCLVMLFWFWPFASSSGSKPFANEQFGSPSCVGTQQLTKAMVSQALYIHIGCLCSVFSYWRRHQDSKVGSDFADLSL